MANDVIDHLKKCIPCIQRRNNVSAVAPLVNIACSRTTELVGMEYVTIEEPIKAKVQNMLVVDWSSITLRENTCGSKALWNYVISGVL